MKKIINLLAVLLISITAAFAQTTTPTTQHLKKDGTVDKRYKANKTAASPSTTAAQTPTPNTVTNAQPTTHLKKDGTPDKRYSSNKSAKSSAPASPAKNPPAQPPIDPSIPATSTAPAKTTNTTATNTTGRHLKKDGTPDMRYKENRTPGLDKNGTPDKRYKQNKPNQ